MKYLVFLLIIFTSCTTARYRRAYRKVVTDPARTEENTKLLLRACETAFPTAAPSITKGKETSSTDTTKPKGDDKPLKEILKVVTKNVNIDSLTEVIKATIEPITIDHWNTRVDTFDRGDTYKVKELQDQLREKDKTIDKLANQVEELKTTVKEKQGTIRNFHFKQWMGWITAGLLVAAWLFIKFYIKR